MTVESWRVHAIANKNPGDFHLLFAYLFTAAYTNDMPNGVHTHIQYYSKDFGFEGALHCFNVEKEKKFL